MQIDTIKSNRKVWLLLESEPRFQDKANC